MSEHVPIIAEYPSGSAGVACRCGWDDPYLWSTVVGARGAWMRHVLAEHFPPAWPGLIALDYQPDAAPAGSDPGGRIS